MGTPFNIYTDHVCPVSQKITSNGSFVVDITTPINNVGNNNSITVHITFKDLVPHEEAGSPGWNILAVLETSDGSGHWSPIGQMFDPIRFLTQGAHNVITVQPNVFNIHEGVPIDIWDGTKTVSRISRQQGILGEDFRLKFIVHETKFGTSDALQSFTVDVVGIRYDI